MNYPLDKMAPIGFRFGQKYPNTAFFRKRKLAGKPHLGIDILARTGTSVKATEEGEARAYWSADTGNTVELVGKYTHRFGHLERPGNSGHVSEGEEIGKSGNTGASTDPHVHWDVRRNGTGISFANFIDPLSLNLEEGDDTMTKQQQLEIMLPGLVAVLMEGFKKAGKAVPNNVGFKVESDVNYHYEHPGASRNIAQLATDYANGIE